MVPNNETDDSAGMMQKLNIAESNLEGRENKLTIHVDRPKLADANVTPLTALPSDPVSPISPDSANSALPFVQPGTIRFQLIPFSDIPGRSVTGEVVERSLNEGSVMHIGRQVIKDGQIIQKSKKKPTELDVWFTSKVVSRTHAEMWVKDDMLYIKDSGSSSGTFLNKMRLSPCGKESRPYPVKQGDVIQFGVDYKGKNDDSFKAMIMKIGFYDQSWVTNQRKKANPEKFTLALSAFLAVSNPYGQKKDSGDGPNASEVDCCICIGSIGPYQALFFAPCSHCYHFKCVVSLISQSPMFQCPMCRQVANLTASVSYENLLTDDKERIVTHPPVMADSVIVQESDLMPQVELEAFPNSSRDASGSGILGLFRRRSNSHSNALSSNPTQPRNKKRSFSGRISSMFTRNISSDRPRNETQALPTDAADAILDQLIKPDENQPI